MSERGLERVENFDNRRLAACFRQAQLAFTESGALFIFRVLSRESAQEIIDIRNACEDEILKRGGQIDERCRVRWPGDPPLLP